MRTNKREGPGRLLSGFETAPSLKIRQACLDIGFGPEQARK